MKLKLLLWLFMSTTLSFAQTSSKSQQQISTQQQIITENKIMKYCKDKWDNDHFMIEYEYKKQIEALLELQEFNNKSKEINAEKEIKNIIKRASSIYWKKNYNIPDYFMVIYECNKQFNAAKIISNYYFKYKIGSVEHNMLNNAIGKYHIPKFDTYNQY